MSTVVKSSNGKQSTGQSLQRELSAVKADLDINKAMNENSPINILLANTDLDITYVNPSSAKTLKTLEHLLPVKVDDLQGQNIDIFHKDPAYQRRILSNDKNLPHRAVIQLGDEKLDLLVSASYDDAGAYLGPMVTWDVVTSKLELEERSRDFQNQIEAINAAQAVIEFEPDGTIITANENFLNVVEYSLDEIQGNHHRIFVDKKYAQSPEYREFWAKLGSGGSHEGEFLRFQKGGGELWLQGRYRALVDQNGKTYKVVK